MRVKKNSNEPVDSVATGEHMWAVYFVITKVARVDLETRRKAT